MTEKGKAVATTARKSIVIHKNSYISYTDKIYYGLQHFQSICKVSVSTGINRKTLCHYVEKLRRWNLIISTAGKCSICGRVEEMTTTNKNTTEQSPQFDEYYRPRKLSKILNEMKKGESNGR
jgi:hypothetical protein